MEFYRITNNLSFNEIETMDPRSVVDIMFKTWIFEPAKSLLNTNNTDNFMATLIILLTYFEVQAQYLNGKDSDRKSAKFFNFSFGKFLDFCNESESKDVNFYNFARCGLFHSLSLRNSVLVDAVNYNGDSIFKNFASRGNKRLIVNVQVFYNKLTEFHELFIKKEMTENFRKTYDRLIVEPGKKLSSNN